MMCFWHRGTSEAFYWITMPFGGAAYGSILTITLVALIASVDPKDMAAATGVTYLFRATGSVLGISLSSAILQNSLQKNWRRRLSQRRSSSSSAKTQVRSRNSASLSVRLLWELTSSRCTLSLSLLLRLVRLLSSLCSSSRSATCPARSPLPLLPPLLALRRGAWLPPHQQLLKDGHSLPRIIFPSSIILKQSLSSVDVFLPQQYHKCNQFSSSRYSMPENGV